MWLSSTHIITEYGILRDVWLIPDLKQNLFSISSAVSKGLTYAGNGKELKFYKGSKELLKGVMRNKLYIIRFNILNKNYAHATLDQWHDRFGHASKDTIRRMIKDNLVHGLKINNSSPKCIDCQLNKCKKTNHPTRSSPKTNVAGRSLHLDTAGPSDQPSLGNSKYTVICKDEASAYRQVAFIKTKDGVPTKVKEFITKTVMETENDVLKIVTDNGSEYCNRELELFLSTKGILHQK